LTTPLIPSPATWSSGPVTTKALRADVTNGTVYLAGRPLFLAVNVTAVTVPATGNIDVPFDTDIIDNWNGHSPAVDNTAYFCQSPGWYLTAAVVYFNYTTTSSVLFTAEIGTAYTGTGLAIIGDQHPGGSGNPPGLLAVDLLPLSTVGTDYIRVVARNAGSSPVGLVNTSPEVSYISARWVAALTGTTGLSVPANPAWPSPPAIVTSSFLNSSIRDTLRFLTYPPLFRGYLATSSGPSLPSQSFPSATVVALDTVTGSTSTGGMAVDNYSGWQSGSHAWQAPAAGVYTLAGQVAVSAGGGGLNVGFAVNSGTVTWVRCLNNPNTGSGPPVVSGVHRARLNAGDTVQLMACQTSGSTVTLYGSGANPAYCKLICVWESA
jgi:hypothetical protein